MNMTPLTREKIEKEFDEKFPHKIMEVIDDFGSTTKSEIKAYVLSTIASVLAKKAEEIEKNREPGYTEKIGHDTEKAYKLGRQEGFNHAISLAQDILKK